MTSKANLEMGSPKPYSRLCNRMRKQGNHFERDLEAMGTLLSDDDLTDYIIVARKQWRRKPEKMPVFADF